MLDHAQRRRHARHLLLFEIGEPGQARLCAARAVPTANADAAARAVALDYAARAGLATGEAVPDADTVALELPDAAGVDALAGRPELRHAAATLAGAFAAVEAIKAAVGVGEAAGPPEGLALAGET